LSDSLPFKHFSVLSLKQDLTLDGLTNIIEENGLIINGEELYSEYIVFRIVAEELITKDILTDQKWLQFFNKVSASNLLRSVKFVLSSCKQCCSKRMFSIVKSLWTDETNRLQMKTVESELVSLKFKMTCMEFHQFVTNEKHLLKATTSDQKYKFKGLSSNNNIRGKLHNKIFRLYLALYLKHKFKS
jgi:hypothetical protein